MKILAVLVIVLSIGALAVSVSAHRTAGRAAVSGDGSVRASVDATRGPDERAMANEIALLRERVHTLEAEVRHLSTQPETTFAEDEPGAAHLDYGRAIESLWRAVDDLRATARFEDPEARERLESAVTDVQARSLEQRREERRAREEARLEARLDELADAARLTRRQREQLFTLAVNERQERRSIIRSARSGEISFGEVREAIRELSEETEAQAREVLDDRQLEHFMAMREEERASFRGRLGGRGGAGRVGRSGSGTAAP